MFSTGLVTKLVEPKAPAKFSLVMWLVSGVEFMLVTTGIKSDASNVAVLGNCVIFTL